MRMLVNVDVDDLERATRFYVDAFGLAVGRRFGAGAIELVGGSAPLYLLVKAPGTSAIPGGGPRTYDRHWTPVHLDVAVDDVVAARDRAVASGATLERDIVEHAWGKLAQLADPFGHGFCLIELSERGYDAIASPTPAGARSDA